MIMIKSPGARAPGNLPLALSELFATVIVVAPADAFAVRDVYSFTLLFAVETILAPSLLRCENKAKGRRENAENTKRKMLNVRFMRAFSFAK